MFITRNKFEHDFPHAYMTLLGNGKCLISRNHTRHVFYLPKARFKLSIQSNIKNNG